MQQRTPSRAQRQLAAMRQRLRGPLAGSRRPTLNFNELRARRLDRQLPDAQAVARPELPVEQTPQVSPGQLALLQANEEDRRREQEAEDRNILEHGLAFLNWYDDNINQPFAGLALGAILSLPPLRFTPAAKQYRDNWTASREDGRASNLWEQSREAYDATDTYWGVKFLTELFADPLNFVGAPWKAARLGAKGATMLARGSGVKLGEDLAGFGGKLGEEIGTRFTNIPRQMQDTMERIHNVVVPDPVTGERILLSDSEKLGREKAASSYPLRSQIAGNHMTTLGDRVWRLRKNLHDVFTTRPVLDPDMTARNEWESALNAGIGQNSPGYKRSVKAGDMTDREDLRWWSRKDFDTLTSFGLDGFESAFDNVSMKKLLPKVNLDGVHATPHQMRDTVKTLSDEFNLKNVHDLADLSELQIMKVLDDQYGEAINAAVNSGDNMLASNINQQKMALFESVKDFRDNMANLDLLMSIDHWDHDGFNSFMKDSKLLDRWSPLYWMFKGMRGALARVFMAGYLPHPKVALARNDLLTQSNQAAQMGVVVGAHMGEHLMQDRRVLQSFGVVGGDSVRNRFGRFFGGLGDIFQTPSGPKRNMAPEQFQEHVMQGLRKAGLDLQKDADMIFDDVVTTGTTLKEMARGMNVERDVVAWVLSRRMSQGERQQAIWRMAGKNANYTIGDEVGLRYGDLLRSENTRKVKGDTQEERLRSLLEDTEPGVIEIGNGFKIELRYVNASDNPLTGIYGEDDVFGIRLTWDLQGKNIVDAVPEDRTQRMLREMGVTADTARGDDYVMPHAPNGVALNLEGVDFDDLRVEFHSHVALEARYHARWLSDDRYDEAIKANDTLLKELNRRDGRRWNTNPRDLDGEEIERLAPDDIDDILSDDQKAMFERKFLGQMEGLNYAYESGAFDADQWEKIEGYIHRVAFDQLDAAGRYTPDTAMRTVFDGTGKATFQYERRAGLYSNLKAGVIYADPMQALASLTTELKEGVARQQFIEFAADHRIFNATANLFINQKKLYGLQGMHALASAFRDKMRHPEAREQLLRNEDELIRTLYAFRRFNEDIGLAGSDLKEADIKLLAKLDYNLEEATARLIDNIGLNDDARRLVETGKKKGREEKHYFGTPQRLETLRRHLHRRVKPRTDPLRVWTARDVGDYKPHMLRDADDVEDLLVQLENAPEHAVKELYFTDPHQPPTGERGVYTVGRFRNPHAQDYETAAKGRATQDIQFGPRHRGRRKIKIDDYVMPGLNEVGISHMRTLASVLQRMSVSKNTLEEALDTGATFWTEFDDYDALRDRIIRLVTAETRKTQARSARSKTGEMDEWLDGLQQQFKGEGLPEETLDELRTVWRDTTGARQTDQLTYMVNLALDDMFDKLKGQGAYERSGRKGGRITRDSAWRAVLGEWATKIAKDVNRIQDDRNTQMIKALANYTSVLDGFADEATGSIGAMRREVNQADAILRKGVIQMDPDASGTLYGGRPGRLVTGTHYDRSGARNPTGDVRDTRTVEGTNIYYGRAVDKRRVPWLANTGYMFTEAGAREFEKLAPDPDSLISKFTTAVEVPNSLMRMLNVSFDGGAFMIQGLGVLATRPDIFAASVARSLPVLLSPKYLEQYMATHYDDMYEMVQNGLILKTSRFENYRFLGQVNALRGSGELLRTAHYPGTGMLDAADAELRVGKFSRPNMRPGISTFGGTPEGAVRARDALAGINLAFLGTAERAEALYNATMFSRHMLWKSSKDTWLRFGGTLPELADTVNHMTGFVDLSGRGITQFQQDVERNFVFFSTHYTRSAMALAGQALSGGIEGVAARTTLAMMLAGGMTTYWALAEALGQDAYLDPRPVSQGGDGGRFMTLEFLGHRIGIGSIWTQIVRLMGAVGTKAFTDPGAYATLDLAENDILRFYRNRTPPILNLTDNLFNAIYREPMYMGERIENIGDVAQVLGGTVSPFWLDKLLIEERANWGSLVAGGAEAMGLRTFPMSLWDEYQYVRDALGMERFGKEWIKLNRRQQQTLKTENPSLQKMQDDIGLESRARRRTSEGDVGLLTDLYFSQREHYENIWRAKIKEKVGLLDTGAITAVEFRQHLKDANWERRAQFRGLEDDPAFQSVQEALAESMTVGRARRTLPIEDIALHEYDRDVRYGSIDDDKGYDFEKRERLDSEFRRKWGDDIHTYVVRTIEEQIENSDFRYPDPIKEYYHGLNLFNGYWNELPQSVIASRPDSVELQKLYTAYQAAVPAERRLMLQDSEPLSDLLAIIAGVRRIKREGNQQLDIFLYRWGYTTTLVHEDNQWDGADVHYLSGIMIGPPYTTIESRPAE